MDYDDQLERALSQTPELTDGADRLEVPEPVVRHEGNVTVFENFPETIDRLDRPAEAVVTFLQNEVGTSAQMDERGRPRLTGEFTAERIDDAIERFAETFVRCPECGLPDTRPVEEQGANLIRCDACGALSPVG